MTKPKTSIVMGKEMLFMAEGVEDSEGYVKTTYMWKHDSVYLLEVFDRTENRSLPIKYQSIQFDRETALNIAEALSMELMTPEDISIYKDYVEKFDGEKNVH